MSVEEVMSWAAFASIFGLVAGIVYSAVRIAVDTERAERLERERDAGRDEGFADGHATAEKTRKLWARKQVGR